MEIITIEKNELLAMIREVVSDVVAESSTPNERPMSKKQLREYLGGKSDTTIYRMMKAGLPHSRNGRNGPPTFIKWQVDMWLAGRGNEG